MTGHQKLAGHDRKTLNQHLLTFNFLYYLNVKFDIWPFPNSQDLKALSHASFQRFRLQMSFLSMLAPFHYKWGEYHSRLLFRYTDSWFLSRIHPDNFLLLRDLRPVTRRYYSVITLSNFLPGG